MADDKVLPLREEGLESIYVVLWKCQCKGEQRAKGEYKELLAKEQRTINWV